MLAKSLWAERNMRILFIIGSLEIGGAEMALLRLISRIDKQRFQPALAVFKPNGALKDSFQERGIEVYEFGTAGWRQIPQSLLKLRGLVRQMRPDLIQGWMYYGNLAALAAAKGLRHQVRVAWGIRHALEELQHFKAGARAAVRLNRLFSGVPAAVIYCSRTSQKQHEAFGFASKNSAWIPNGCDLREFASRRQARANLSAMLGSDSNACLIGLVARCHPDKDIGNFLSAAKLICQTRPDCQLALIGRGLCQTNEGLVHEIASHGLASHAHLLGEQTRANELLAGLDLLINSSRTEAFPNVLMEAMACKLPCVATDVGDTSWITAGNAVLVPRENPQALADGALRWLQMSAAQRSALTDAAFERVRSEMTIEVMAARYQKLYDRILA